MRISFLIFKPRCICIWIQRVISTNTILSSVWYSLVLAQWMVVIKMHHGMHIRSAWINGGQEMVREGVYYVMLCGTYIYIIILLWCRTVLPNCASRHDDCIPQTGKLLVHDVENVRRSYVCYFSYVQKTHNSLGVCCVVWWMFAFRLIEVFHQWCHILKLIYKDAKTTIFCKT